MTQKSVDREEITTIMICARAQMLRFLRNSPSWPNFKIRSADQGRFSLPLHYFFFFYFKKIFARKFNYAEFHLLTEYFMIYLLTRPNYTGGSSDTCLGLNDWTGYSPR